MQSINSLLKDSVPPSNILYATFDHPLLSNITLEELLEIWKEFEASKEGMQYLFLDEIQYMKNWQTSLKHQVDFEKKRRIVVTGSADTPYYSKSRIWSWQMAHYEFGNIVFL